MESPLGGVCGRALIVKAACRSSDSSVRIAYRGTHLASGEYFVRVSAEDASGARTPVVESMVCMLQSESWDECVRGTAAPDTRELVWLHPFVYELLGVEPGGRVRLHVVRDLRFFPDRRFLRSIEEEYRPSLLPAVAAVHVMVLAAFGADKKKVSVSSRIGDCQNQIASKTFQHNVVEPGRFYYLRGEQDHTYLVRVLEFDGVPGKPLPDLFYLSGECGSGSHVLEWVSEVLRVHEKEGEYTEQEQAAVSVVERMRQRVSAVVRVTMDGEEMHPPVRSNFAAGDSPLAIAHSLRKKASCLSFMASRCVPKTFITVNGSTSEVSRFAPLVALTSVTASSVDIEFRVPEQSPEDFGIESENCDAEDITLRLGCIYAEFKPAFMWMTEEHIVACARFSHGDRSWHLFVEPIRWDELNEITVDWHSIRLECRWTSKTVQIEKPAFHESWQEKNTFLEHLVARLKNLMMASLLSYKGCVGPDCEDRMPGEYPLLDTSAYVGASAAKAKRIEMGGAPESVRMFKAQGVLTQDECKFCVGEAEKLGLKGVEWEYAPSYRKCDRVVVTSPSLANTLWERVKPLLRREDIYNVRPFGFHQSGTWRPVGVNPCIRFTRYSAGHHFQPHRDGSFVSTDEHRSVFTLMVYLNDRFDGGQTVFYSARARAAPNGEPLPRDEHPRVDVDAPACVVVPKQGTALIFTHDAWHAGNTVLQGQKYILRTDIMFDRVSLYSEISWFTDKSAGIYRPTSDERYVKAEALYQESIQLQKDGDAAGSTECYLEALDMQASLYPSVLEAVPTPCETLGLPLDVWRIVLDWCSVRDLLGLARVSKAFHYVARDGWLWRRAFAARWPGTELPYAVCSSNINGDGDAAVSEVDWYRLYKQRTLAARDFDVIVMDVGSRWSKHAMVTSMPVQLIAPTPTVIARVRGHYWGARSGHDEYYVGREVSGRYTYDPMQPGVGRANSFSFQIMSEVIKYIPYSGVCGGASHRPIEPQLHPLLLCTKPFWADPEISALRDFAFSMGYPFVACVPAPVLALFGASLSTGLVVDAGASCLCVSAVFDGVMLRETVQCVDAPCDEKNENVLSLLYGDGASDVIAAAVASLQAVPESRRGAVARNVMVVGGRAEPVHSVLESSLERACATAGMHVSLSFVAVDSPLYAIAAGGQGFASTSLSTCAFFSAPAVFDRLKKPLLRDSNKKHCAVA